MADFFQNGEITNLHRLRPGGIERLERELEGYAKMRPVALVLPALYSDLKAKPFKNILSEISQVQYLNEVVVTLGRATKEEFADAKSKFSSLAIPVSVLWK